ncbi:MAG: DUF4290 domain-containing protein [Chitinophagaceae bacterium]
MEYNTTRNFMIMKEYGRNIQKMIEFILTIEDKEVRQRNAMSVIELMGVLNPHLRNVEDFRHKLWDHLFLISDFKLEVDSPYPIPTRESLRAKPEILPYPKRYPKQKHFGKNLEMVIEKALKETDPEKKEGFTQVIGNYMKLAYSNWHKENVHDDMVKNELAIITNNELIFQNTYQSTPSFAPDNTFRLNKRRSFQNKNTGTSNAPYKNNNNPAGKPVNFKHNKYNKNRNK